MPRSYATPSLLDDARRAYHALQTGAQARVVVDQNGERVEFVASNKQGLYAYIQQLETELGVGCGGTPTPIDRFHPAGFLF